MWPTCMKCGESIFPPPSQHICAPIRKGPLHEDKRILFAAGLTSTNGAPLVLMGISRAAFDDLIAMGNERAVTIDLTKVGLGLNLMVFANETPDACRARLHDVCKQAGIPLQDERHRDFSIGNEESNK